MARGSWLTANFQLKKVPLGTTDYRQVWRAELGMPATHARRISKCYRHDREVDSFLFFTAKKRNRKKLAAADKYAKILSFSLDKNKLASLRQYFCLNRSTTKFLDAISPRRQELLQRTTIRFNSKIC